MKTPRMVPAEIPGRELMYYLVDDALDFIPEVKEFLDWKAATRRAPATIKAYCSRLEWYYRFLSRKHLRVVNVTPADITEFVIWLCNPYREAENVSVNPLQETSVNLILQAVGALYRFLIRRGQIHDSPVVYVDIPRGRWLTERDLLAHTRPSQQRVQRMELKLKEPITFPKTVSEQDFKVFVESIHVGNEPFGDPSGFRDRLLCLLLMEGGLRIGELLGMHMEDLEFGKQGVHIRFRADNENGARAKAGYGRDRFVHLPPDILGLLDMYITEVWIEAAPHTEHLWIVLKKGAKNREGSSTFGTALALPAVEEMFRHYSKKSGVDVHPHLLRHSHATQLVRSYLRDGQPVDWKFVQERLGHASVVTTMQTYTHLTNDDRKLAYDNYLTKKGTVHARP